MNSFFHSRKGQLFSLDVVLAAVIFTLALGLIVNQSELWVLNSQSQRENQELHNYLVLASNALVSKPELWASVAGSSAVNLRCVPNEWKLHNDYSWVENCMWRVTSPATVYVLPPQELGLPSNYLYQLRIGINPIPIYPTSSATVIPFNQPIQTLDRDMLVFDSNPSALQISTCLNAGCPLNIQTVQLTIWKGP